MIDERKTYHIAVFETGTQLSGELRAAVRPQEGPPRFVIASRSCPQALSPHQCKLLIIDVDGRGDQGLNLLAQCREFCPHLPAVVLVGHGDTSAAIAAMKAGAADCLEKPVKTEDLLSLAETVLQQRQLAHQNVGKALTRTEARVLHLILAGNTNLQIAGQVHRSKRTIDVHRRHIMRKLEVSCVSELVRKAFQAGLIDKEPPGHLPGSDKHRLESLS